jgi:hypothetical protein
VLRHTTEHHSTACQPLECGHSSGQSEHFKQKLLIFCTKKNLVCYAKQKFITQLAFLKLIISATPSQWGYQPKVLSHCPLQKMDNVSRREDTN